MSAEQIRIAFDGLKTHFWNHPDEAVVSDSFAVARLTDGLRMTVEGPSGQSVASDMPKSFGGSGGAPTPGWYMRAGLASCTATVILLRAAEQSIPVQHLAVKVESRSNEFGALGLDDGVPAGPLEVTMTVEIRSEGTSREALGDLVDWGIAHSSMADALQRAVPLARAVNIL
jgi:uncharacterized OsmC-like protein